MIIPVHNNLVIMDSFSQLMVSANLSAEKSQAYASIVLSTGYCLQLEMTKISLQNLPLS